MTSSAGATPMSQSLPLLDTDGTTRAAEIAATFEDFASLGATHLEDGSLSEQVEKYRRMRNKTEGQQLVAIGQQHRALENEVSRFHDDGLHATPVTDAVGIVLGKMRDLALRLESRAMTDLVDDLIDALDDQLSGMYRHFRSEPIVEPAPKIKPFEADEELAKLRRDAEHAAQAAIEATRSRPFGAALPGLGASPAVWNLFSRKKSIASDLGGSMLIPASSTQFSLIDAVSITPCLIAESLATVLQAESVNIYLADEPGVGLHFAASYPPWRPATPEERPPQLPRTVASAVFAKGMAVIGHDLQQQLRGQTDGGLPEQEMPDEGTGARKQLPKTCLFWPVEGRSSVDSTTERRLHLGVIEAVNKAENEDGPASRFSDADEVVMHVASKLLSSMMNRHNPRLFNKVVGAQFEALARPVAPRDHIEPVLDVDLLDARRVANECLRRDEMMYVFRGPSTAVNKPINTPSRKADVFSTASAATANLNSVEYAIDSLNSMWKVAYQENTLMHDQCRKWATQVSELNQITHAFQDALIAARGIDDVEELHLYLRSMELGLKSGNSKTIETVVDKTLDELIQDRSRASSPLLVAGSGPSSGRGSPLSAAPRPAFRAISPRRHAAETAHKRQQRNPISKMYVDGPQNVRTYTTDPETRREQARAIDQYLDTARREKEAELADTSPRFMKTTATREQRLAKTRRRSAEEDPQRRSTAFSLQPPKQPHPPARK